MDTQLLDVIHLKLIQCSLPQGPCNLHLQVAHHPRAAAAQAVKVAAMIRALVATVDQQELQALAAT